jgi:hypothetical protein
MPRGKKLTAEQIIGKLREAEADPEDPDTPRRAAQVPARFSRPRPPTDQRELMQAHDDRDVFQALPDEMPAIDIHSL